MQLLFQNMIRHASMFSYTFLLIFIFSSCSENEVAPLGEFMQINPADGSKDVVLKPKFKWNDAKGVVTYTLQLSKQADFSLLDFEIKDLFTTSFDFIEELDPGYRYYWRVKAINKGGELLSQNAGSSFRALNDPITPSPEISIYYVSPSGEDNPDRGTQINPYKTLAYAATQIPEGEGDTIQLTAGTFVETEPAAIPLGVNVLGAGEDQTILSSSGVSIPEGIDINASDFKIWYDGSLVQLVSKHRTVFRNTNSSVVKPAKGNQTIAHLTIDGNNKKLKAGVWVENRDNVTMHHVTFKNLAQRGAVFAPGNKNWYVYPEYYMQGIKIHDCTFINSGKDLPDESLGNLNIAQLDGAEIYNITINDTEGYGIKFMIDGYFKNTKIHDCTITLNESDAKWGEDIAIEVWNLGPGNEIYNINCNTWLSIVNHPEMFGAPTGTENMKVYNVKMIDLDGNSSKEAVEIGAPGVAVYDSYFENKGFGMAIWDMGRQHIVIRNNIFFNTTPKNNWTGGAAIYIDNSRTWNFSDIHIYNNVFDTYRIPINIKGDKISDIFIRNNAFLNTTVTDVQAQGTSIFVEHNLKYTTTDELWFFNGVTSENNNIRGLPGFLNTGNRWDTYYTPASGTSLVIDKGVDVGFPFNGAAPDIGFFEY